MRQLHLIRPDDQIVIEAIKRDAGQRAGIFHRSHLLAQGLSGDQIRGWAAKGIIEPRFRWTFAFPGTSNGVRARAWSAQLSLGGDAMATSSQALALMEVIPELTGPFECVRSRGQTRRQSGLVVHRSERLTADDSTELRGGLRCAAFARAVLDLAARGDADVVARALDRGTRLRLFDARAFARLQTEYPGAPGHALLARELSALNTTTGLTRSELERRLVRLIVNSSMPTPLVNAMLGQDEVDISWIGTRAIIEADGREFHSSPADIANDIARQQRLEAYGFVVKRFDWHAVTYEPERTLERAEAFRRANVAPPVPGLPRAAAA